MALVTLPTLIPMICPSERRGEPLEVDGDVMATLVGSAAAFQLHCETEKLRRS